MFRVVLLSENEGSEHRARDLFSRLEERLCDAMELSAESWPWRAIIGDEQARLSAAAALARAEMVFVSMDGLRPLPKRLQSWLDEVLVQSGRVTARAIVVLIGHPTDPAAPVMPVVPVDCLKDVARRAGMDFFQYRSGPGEQADALCQTGKWIALRGSDGSGAFDPNSPSAAHWGINE